MPPDHGGSGNPTSSHSGSSISGDSEVSSVYTCFACGSDGQISRFCSQIQSLADHSSDNNILYPHGPQLLVCGDSHVQNVQALTPGHRLTKGTNPILNHLLNLIELEIDSELTQRYLLVKTSPVRNSCTRTQVEYP